LDCGLHVLVEKPMANTVEECDRMIRAAERSGKKLAVGHMNRFYPAIQKVKEIHDSKELGELCMVNELRSEHYFIEERPKCQLDQKLTGGGMVGKLKNNYTIEGHAQAHVELENQVSANITIGGYPGSISEVTFYFAEGILKVERNNRGLSRNQGNGWETIELDLPNAFGLQLHEFCKFVNGEPSEIADSEYGRLIIATIEQVYQ